MGAQSLKYAFGARHSILANISRKSDNRSHDEELQQG
jgi:hypothetical protein